MRPRLSPPAPKRTKIKSGKIKTESVPLLSNRNSHICSFSVLLSPRRRQCFLRDIFAVYWTSNSRRPCHEHPFYCCLNVYNIKDTQLSKLTKKPFSLSVNLVQSLQSKFLCPQLCHMFLVLLSNFC